ncbi:head-tail adaptor [Klebsiella phage vB_Kpl_K72PH164C2]|uniref:Head-tail adaptor n=1 Tax=Klebsiella phage vB_Kpl_K72PH164C2 TaxID=3071646 RepID=A0AAD2GPK6_9CAUD|nr:head-tail adaptor [Klebsiella phage vB_Kpl_K72PH164C2]
MLHDTLEAVFAKDTDPGVLDASEQFAQWTVPTIFTRDIYTGDGKRTQLSRDYQSTGALLINSAATKIVDALFPQGNPFFRFSKSETLESFISSLGNTGAGAASTLSEVERTASMKVFERDGYASKLRAVKLLLVTGNALEYIDERTGKSHIYTVRDFTVRRDGSGNVLRIIVKERACVQDLPPGFQSEYYRERDPYSDVDIYTGICRQIKHTEAGEDIISYKVWQEVKGKKLGEPSTYPELELPFNVIVWNLVNGEHYGRGLVEDYAGDFARLSVLSESLTNYEVETARLINLVDSASGLDIDEFEKAETGQAVQCGGGGSNGNSRAPVTAYEGGSAQKIQWLSSDIANLEQKLARAFLYSGNTRQGERVTAYEIRQNAKEAESAMGGGFSVLSDTWLRKLAYLYTAVSYPKFRLYLQAGLVDINVLVGTAALAKSAEADKLLEATQAMQLAIPVLAQITPRLNADALVDWYFDAYGIVSEPFMLTAEQLQAKQEQQQTTAGANMQEAQDQLQAADPTIAGQQLGLLP